MNRIEQIWEKGSDNYILPFLWMHGASDEKKKKMIDVIYESGARAVCLEARPHPDFAGPLWWHDVEVILEEAKKKDMKVWILDDAHFPTGLANGAVEHAPERLKRICLTEQHMDISGPVSDFQVNVKEQLNCDPETGNYRPDYYKEKVVEVLLGKLETKENREVIKDVICLTDQIKDGILQVTIPEGTYRLFIITSKIHASKFLSDAISFLEPESVDLLINAVYEPHYQHFSEWFGNTIAGFFSDEPGFFNLKDRGYGDVLRTGDVSEPLPWNEKIYRQLQEKYAGDVRLRLPSLFGMKSDQPGEDRKLCSLYMDLITKEYEKNFPEKLSKWCNEHKVEYIGHVVEDIPSYERLGQGTGHYFRAIRQQDMAGIDVVLNSLLPEKEDFYLYGLPQLAASCAAHSGKQKGRAMCELFGAYGWSEGVTFMKWMADYMLLHGINMFVPHAFTDSSFPDADCPPHFWAEGNNPQYPSIGQLFRYMNRMADLLSKAKANVKNAVLFEAESDWAGATQPYCEVGRELIIHQMEYHLLCMDDLRCADCQSGEIYIENQKYSRLFIPSVQYMSRENAKILEGIKKRGIRIYFTDGKPLSLEGEELKELDAIPVISLDSVSEKAEQPMVRLDGNLVKWVHCSTYENNDEILHVLLNTSLKKSVKARMTVQPVRKEKSMLLRVDMMEQRYLGRYEFQTEIVLEPGEMAVFSEVPETELSAVILSKEEEQWVPLLTEEWSLSAASYQTPDLWKKLGTLKKLDDLYVRYPDFSGTVRYEAEVSLEHVKEIWLKGASEAVTVRIDGEKIGRCIGTPYRYQLSDGKNGKVTLCIEVASTLYGAVKDDLSKARELPRLGFEGEVWVYKKGEVDEQLF